MNEVRSRLAALAPAESSRVGYLLRLSRPRFWLYLAGPVLVGAIYGASTPREWLTPLIVALTAYFLVPANVFLYGVNDIFDADVDEQNPKKEGREVRYDGSRLVVVAVVVSGGLGLTFVPALAPAGIVALAGFLALAVEYSAPPLRFKTTPFLDSASNGLYLLPGVIAYTAVAGTAPPPLAIVGGWLWTMGMHTFSAIPDIEPDRAAGIETTATVLGEMGTFGYCAGVWAMSAVAFGLVHPGWGVVIAFYPLCTVGVAASSVTVDRAYWWFPIINGVVGTSLSMAGIWGLVYA